MSINVLFVCSKNKWRSPTAEQVFAGYPGIECSSAGLSSDAENRLTAEQVEWADVICVMERAHKAKLSTRFKKHLKDVRIVCLDIPDKYTYMDPALVALLESRGPRFLPQSRINKKG